MIEELRRAQRDYGAAYANVLMLAKQSGLDRPTVERLMHALTLGPSAGVRRGEPCPSFEVTQDKRGVLRSVRADRLLDRQGGGQDGDHMQAALQRAALAFRQLIDMLHKLGGASTV